MTALGDRLSQYVALRRGLGAQFHEPARALGQFVAFLEREGAECITTALALRWAMQPEHAQRATWARRLTQVRGFATWLSAVDPRTQIPPRHLISGRRQRRKPHIFTDREVGQLLAEAARLRSSNGLRALTYTTLIGLLASTGLRPGEALALDLRDLDLQNGVLTIRESKFGKSRFVPLDPTTCAALQGYVKKRNRLYAQSETEAFLVSEYGTRLQGGAARRTFAKLSSAVGLRPKGEKRVGRGPRLQDLRHSFATRKLLEWYRSGVDVQRALPTLATYLGHVAVDHTYWYLEGVPELLQLATEYVGRQSGGER